MQIRHTPLSGGYCGEVPPLPIPNREVKLTCADGTAMQCGRVGSRLLSSEASITKVVGAFLFSCGFCFLTLIAFLCWFFSHADLAFPSAADFQFADDADSFSCFFLLLFYPFTLLSFYSFILLLFYLFTLLPFYLQFIPEWQLLLSNFSFRVALCRKVSKNDKNASKSNNF